MITVFSTCKPFTDETDFRQRNAIESWLLFTSDVILFGDDEGVAETAQQLGCRHMPDVGCNEYGRPLVNAMFRRAQEISTGSRFCYVNADNMLAGLDDAFACCARKFKRFMLIGRRWNWLNPVRVEVAEGWQDEVLKKRGRLDTAHGMEYFGFTRGLFRNLLPFAVGWPGWDNWLMLHALRLKIPVVDATDAIQCIHQDHVVPWRADTGNPQFKRNIKLMRKLIGPDDKRGRTKSATWIMKNGKLKRRGHG